MILSWLFAPRLARAERERDALQAKLDAAHESLVDLRRIISGQQAEIGTLSRTLDAEAYRAQHAEAAMAYATEQAHMLAAGAVGLAGSWERLGDVGSVRYAARELYGLLQQLGVVATQIDATPAPVGEPT